MATAIVEGVSVEELAVRCSQSIQMIRIKLRSGELPGLQVAGHWFVPPGEARKFIAKFPLQRSAG